VKIVIVGAAGMVGSRVLTEAAGRGHDVLAIVRTRRPDVPDVPVVEADAGDSDRMATVFAGADAVVAAARPAPGEEHTVAATTTALLDAAGTRILVVGGAAPLRVPGGGLVLDDPRYVPPEYRAIASASAAQLEVCRAHPADWVYLSPPAVLEPGARTGVYRRGTTTLLVRPDGSSRISAEDLAAAVVDELENPGPDRHFTVGY
jgi:putative NADH-flavin reductase